MATIVKTPVLIVGAGPTGLMLSAQLLRYGAEHIVVDKKSGITTQSKALAVQARTLEFYQQLGLADEARRRGFIGRSVRVVVNGERRAMIDLSEMGGNATPFPYIFVLEQSENEDLLANHLVAQGGGVRWQHDVSSITRVDAGFVVQLSSPTGPLDVHCQYLVGCDGARSPVRHFSNVDFVGTTSAQQFFVADVQLEADLGNDSVALVMNRDAFLAFFPMSEHGHKRALGVVPPSLNNMDELDFDDLKEHIESNLGLPGRVTEHSWHSSYRVHHRVVSRFADNGLFIAGDAAHLHSPAGGQGMNTGLGDAVNLGWKLAAALHGDPSWLPTYDLERRPFAEQLVATTDRMFGLMVSKDPTAVFVRTRLMPKIIPLVIGLPFARRLAFKTVSQIGLNYRHSPKSLRQRSGRFESGDRFPWFQFAGGHSFDWFGEPGRCVVLADDPARNVHVGAQLRKVQPTTEARQAMREVGLGEGPIVVRPDMHLA